MEDFENVPLFEPNEKYVGTQSSPLMLCKSDDEQINDYSLNCNNPELSHTSDLYSKITNIVYNFSNQNFCFPGYYEKIDPHYRLRMLLNDNTLKEDTEYPLCSMVKNEDLAEYFSNYSKNNIEGNPTKIKFLEQIDKRNKFIESEEESSSNENSNISTSSDVSISSLAKKDENDTFEENSYNLMETSTDEVSTGYQSSTKIDVGNPCCISIFSPASDSLINSDEELYVKGNNIDTNESENSLTDNCENEIKLYMDRNNDFVNEPEYILMDVFYEEELESNPNENNDLPESKNKIMTNDENKIRSHHNDDDISELENKIMDNYESEVKSDPDKNEDGIPDSGNKNIDNYEDEEVKEHLDGNNEVIESENKISDDENEVKSHLIKNNDEAKSKKEIEENYEMLDKNQTDLLNSTITSDDDDESDVDSMDLIILDSTDASVDKEEEFNMKAEKIYENDVFDAEKENICLQSNIKQNNSEDESDCLIVTIDDTDTFSDKILSEKCLQAKKIETKMEASPNLITSTNAPKENIRENESSSNTEIKKSKYTINDPLKIKNINETEWKNMKSLTIDERYSAVKSCWSSKNIPNPHKDITCHDLRLKRLRKEGIKSDIIERKRTATTESEKLVDPKRQKIESFSCTEILDQRINKKIKLYRQKFNEKECIYLNGLQKINNEVEREREKLREIYTQRFVNSYQAGPLNHCLWLSYQFGYFADLERFDYPEDLEDIEAS